MNALLNEKLLLSFLQGSQGPNGRKGQLGGDGDKVGRLLHLFCDNRGQLLLVRENIRNIVS